MTATTTESPIAELVHLDGCPSRHERVEPIEPAVYAPAVARVRCVDCGAEHPPTPSGLRTGPMQRVNAADNVTMEATR